ncbi:MAG: mandelate racemase/muconate lactonizing enzyme family protein [Thaumarchaeota archaeon]|nr:mandelate racemase/muconate lactonizing enzyme family protein [Nitrososphaerota archaeon]
MFQNSLGQLPVSMKIASIEFIPVSLPLPAPFHPAWFPNVTQKSTDGTLIKVHADDGTVGYGWQNSFGTEVKIVGESRVFKDLILGKDVFNVEEIIRILTGITYSMNTLDLLGVEMALWDIIGKSCGKPVHKLLGGAKERVKAYASTAMLKEPEEHARDAVKYRELGFRAIKIRIHHDKLEDDVAGIRAVRDALKKDEIEIMVDANQAATFSGPVWSYQRALETARELEKLEVYWLEEPLFHEAHEDLARLSRAVELQIAGGEDEYGFFRFKDIIDHGCFDIIQADVSSSGGIFQLRKVAILAESVGKLFVPHSFDTGLSMAAALQVIGASPNSPYVEYAMEYPSLDLGHDKLLKTQIEVSKDGYVDIPSLPGLGVEINEELIEKSRI